MRVISRIEKKIALHGEDVTFQRTGGSSTARGFFRIVDTGTLRTYFDDTEAAAVERPTLFFITTADADIALDDTLTRDGRSYSVYKIVITRFGGKPIAKTAALI